MEGEKKRISKEFNKTFYEQQGNIWKMAPNQGDLSELELDKMLDAPYTEILTTK